ncbi:MAG TPA: hypothetical protein VHE79_00170, partial [Spirochaetia bacterium]
MKTRVEKHLGPLVEEFTGAPDRQDALERTLRVQELFRQLPEITDESIVPPRSLLREFIGGSAYTY